MALFAEWGVGQTALFTLALGAKLVALYQQEVRLLAHRVRGFGSHGVSARRR